VEGQRVCEGEQQVVNSLDVSIVEDSENVNQSNSVIVTDLVSSKNSKIKLWGQFRDSKALQCIVCVEQLILLLFGWDLGFHHDC
jgi:hypothetical protein